MSEQKKRKRDIRTVWDAVRRDRRDRAKLTSVEDLTESAHRLSAHAAALTAFAQSAAQSDATSPEEDKPTTKTKSRVKAKRKRTSTKKTKK